MISEHARHFLHRPTFYKTHNNKELHSQFFFFRFTFVIVKIFSWAFFSILLYQATDSIQYVILERLIHYTFLGMGFLTASFFIDHVGIRQIYRLSMLLQAVSALFLVYWIQEIAAIFFLITILQSLGEGLYWAASRDQIITQFQYADRKSTLSVVFSIEILFSALLPALSGFVLTETDSYQLVFLIALFIYSSAFVIPFSFNHVTTHSLRYKDILTVLRHKKFPVYFFSNFVVGMLSSLFSSLFLIIPYLIFLNELDVGLVVSLAAIIAGVLGLVQRNMSTKRRFSLGALAYTSIMIANILLAVIWNPILMVIRSIVNAFALIFGTSARAALAYDLVDEIVQDRKEKFAAEINMITEMINTIARIVTFSMVLLLLSIHPNQAEEIIRITLIILSPGFLLIYLFMLRVTDEKEER